MARDRKAAALLVAAAFGLSGCMDLGGFLAGGAGVSNARAPASVQVMSKTFTVAGPRGFCVDTSAIREKDDGAFVLLGSCSAISGNPRDAKPRRPAILTASVAPAAEPLDSAALDRMAAFFSTEPGRAVLSRADDAAPVEVLDMARDEGVLLVHASDGTDDGAVAGDYWRGIFGMAGELVTVTVSGFRETPLDDNAGADLAQAFIRAIREANPPKPDPAAETGGLASLFNRLP